MTPDQLTPDVNGPTPASRAAPAFSLSRPASWTAGSAFAAGGGDFEGLARRSGELLALLYLCGLRGLLRFLGDIDIGLLLINRLDLRMIFAGLGPELKRWKCETFQTTAPMAQTAMVTRTTTIAAPEPGMECHDP